MIGIRAQLTDLAHATHEQTKTVAQYTEKNNQWLVSNDRKFVRGNIKQVRENLTHLQHSLKPSYLEGELVHFSDLLWIQYENDQTFSRMERLIDEMSEQVIDDYVGRKLIKNIDEDDRRHLKKYARKLQHSHQGGRGLTAPCASTFTPRSPIGGLAPR